ncbi:acidic leucine-rich nuclear phosphoprotein 32 family member B-like [Gossypium australe]|uniref:Acidic leucine-rich nuclear phosphoprotein 32 family member B-like n=1 Tax=Gossypium australe TaxID=47621 RepID=A0A5B6VXW9_9ROSI|nr:acidic leucine-rich nuclear phosphoprotein 32 family member B-like [Gossypium australe]
MKTYIKHVQFECTNSTRTLLKLEDEMSQLMSMMRDITRQIGIGIPSNTENNPLREEKEHVKAIALRYGKVLSSPENPTKEMNKENTNDLQEEPLEVDDEPEPVEVVAPTIELEIETIKYSIVAKISFPSRHRKIKLICEKLGLGDLKNTQITLQLADKSSVHLKRVLEDVLVKVRSFIISVDFVVLDFEEDREIPILLERPNLATSRSTIDLENNELTMKINGEIKVSKCDHQQSVDNKRDFGEHCNELSIFNPNNPESRDLLPLIHAGQKNKFKEIDQQENVELHDRRWTNTKRTRDSSLCEIMVLSD